MAFAACRHAIFAATPIAVDMLAAISFFITLPLITLRRRHVMPLITPSFVSCRHAFVIADASCRHFAIAVMPLMPLPPLIISLADAAYADAACYAALLLLLRAAAEALRCMPG